MKDALLKKLRDRTAVISVIGLGYTVLPVATLDEDFRKAINKAGVKRFAIR